MYCLIKKSLNFVLVHYELISLPWPFWLFLLSEGAQFIFWDGLACHMCSGVCLCQISVLHMKAKRDILVIFVKTIKIVVG